MKIFSKQHEGESIARTIIGYRIQYYKDASVLLITLYLKVIIFRLEIGIPNGKKPETL